MDFKGFDHPGAPAGAERARRGREDERAEARRVEHDRPLDPGFGALEASDEKGVTRSVKVMIAGGFGTGKTTMVHSVSDIKPLTTEETLTQASADVDHLIGVTDKTETTVSLDFGKIGINDELVLYLFGTPGQERFWFLWNGLFKGALGAVVLVDTRRLASSFRAIEEMERQDVPFVIALNVFPDSPEFPVDEIRDALDISPDIPVVACDARDRSSSRDVLVALIRHLKERTAVVALEPR